MLCPKPALFSRAPLQRSVRAWKKPPRHVAWERPEGQRWMVATLSLLNFDQYPASLMVVLRPPNSAPNAERRAVGASVQPRTRRGRPKKM